MRNLLLFVTLLVAMVGGSAGPASAQLFQVSADISADLMSSYDQDLLVQVSNAGPGDAVGTIEVALPAGLRAIALPAGCAQGDGWLRCETPELMPESRTTFPIEIIQTARGPQRVTATVTGNLNDPNAGNNSAAHTIRTLPTPAMDADPVGGAVAVSALRFPDPAADPAAHVVLARSDAFADSLAGTALTGRAPLLYTPSDRLDARAAQEIDRVLPNGGTVYVLGGSAAVADTVLDTLRQAGHVPVRLAGDSRITTALAIADQVVALSGSTSAVQEVVLARAYGEGTAAWADSVAMGGYAALTGSPVLLTPTESLAPAVAEWLARHAPVRALIAGGTAAIADDVVAQIPSAERVAGADRAATAAAVAARFPVTRDRGEGGYHLINGWAENGWAHGLVAAGLVAEEGAPLLFTTGDSAPEATRQAVTSCRDNPVPLAVVGGSDAVDDELRSELDELDAPACD